MLIDSALRLRCAAWQINCGHSIPTPHTSLAVGSAHELAHPGSTNCKITKIVTSNFKFLSQIEMLMLQDFVKVKTQDFLLD